MQINCLQDHSSIFVQVVIHTIINIIFIVTTSLCITRIDSIQQIAQPLAGRSRVPGQDRAQQGPDRIHCRIAALIGLWSILLLFFVVVYSKSFVHDLHGQTIYDLIVVCPKQLKNNLRDTCQARTRQQDMSIYIRRHCLVLLAQDDSAVLNHRIFILRAHFCFDCILFEPRDHIRIAPQRCIALDKQFRQVLYGRWYERRAGEISVLHDIAGRAISLAVHECVYGHFFEQRCEDHREQHETVLQQLGTRQQYPQILLATRIVVVRALSPRH